MQDSYHSEIHITLLDGYFASYFMENTTEKPLIKPSYLTFEYKGYEYRMFREWSNYTVSPMSEKIYDEFVSKLDDLFKEVKYVIPTFEEVWMLMLNEIVGNSIKIYNKYTTQKITKIIFTISESYKYLTIYDTVLNLIAQISHKFNINTEVVNYANSIENTMYKDCLILIGSEKINFDENTKQKIFSFIEFGLNSIMLYTMELNFDNKYGVTLPTSSKILEKVFIPIGLSDLFIETFGGNQTKSLINQHYKFLSNLDSNIKLLINLNSTHNSHYLDLDDDVVRFNKDDLNRTNFVNILESHVNNIENTYNPSNIKIVSYLTLSFLLYQFINVRTSNGTEIGSFYATGYNSVIYEGSFKTDIHPYEIIPENRFYPLNTFVDEPLINYVTIRLKPKSFKYAEVINYFNGLFDKHQHYLSIKSKINKESTEIIRRSDKNLDIRKYLTEAKKIISFIAMNDADKLYELWQDFTSKLLN